MLLITVPDGELWDEVNEKLIRVKAATLKLEHSLISISKWESKWCVPFMESEKTSEQILDYVKCMTLNTNVDPMVYNNLTRDNIEAINQYIAAPMTASTITPDESARKKSSEFVTSELIYYWMIAYNIPVEFEKWHINRLIMLIRICSEKNKPEKKMTKAEIMRRHRALNQARRAKAKKKR